MVGERKENLDLKQPTGSLYGEQLQIAWFSLFNLMMSLEMLTDCKKSQS